ncbi:hypothetical protein ASPACDRAFT_125444 [Aspergillus aculeatus ATCC 16872]|uniref:Uncharacterized protein n=1 Tax=Aspergillus aculeatus (strain ATCC 16872 / CBS 172.66 / WB 5094) TaxID=690307 RepID=A0A1L9WKK7_ASPA1|nr:uncharacterized protein ASPACDRAFT_125444 [Aspergillus aculeatus ATCC 16872]OJJ96688.1 hypothetical protein ASPACDRAFT_125444 [Aspergillus aculeatus ATCC 16872]
MEIRPRLLVSREAIDSDSESEARHHHRRPRASLDDVEQTPVKTAQKGNQPSSRRSVTIIQNDAPTRSTPERPRHRSRGRKRTSSHGKTSTKEQIKRLVDLDYLKAIDHAGDIDDRIARFLRFEKAQKEENKQKEQEEQELEKKLQDLSREAAEKEALERKAREEKLDSLERRLEDQKRREELRNEIRNEEARNLLAEQERTAREAAVKAAAVEEYKQAEVRRRLEEKRLRSQIWQQCRAQIEAELGYSLPHVKSILDDLIVLRRPGGIERAVPRRRRSSSLTSDADDEDSS